MPVWALGHLVVSREGAGYGITGLLLGSRRAALGP